MDKDSMISAGQSNLNIVVYFSLFFFSLVYVYTNF